MQQNRNAKEIAVNKIFTGINESIVLSIFNHDRFIRLKEGEIIYQAGDENSYLYLLIRGEVKIKYARINYVSNKSFNDFFGEKEIVDDSRRISSAVANSNCLIYKIEKNLLKKLVTKNPALNTNLEKYGEIELPEVNTSGRQTFNFNGASKPISFSATNVPLDNAWDEAIKTEEPADNDDIKNEHELEKKSPEEKIEFVSKEVKDEEKDIKEVELSKPDNEIDADGTDLKIENVEENNKIDDLPATPDEVLEAENEKGKDKEQDLMDREQLRKVFGSIDGIYSGMKLLDTVKAIKRSIMELTQSEGVELLLIDEKTFEMQKLVEKDKSYVVENFVLPEGLAGNCALQKKIINYDRPTDDSRFVSKIDQPGSARLKSILYFPVINEGGDTIAVLVLGRESKKYSENEITYITMVSKQIERALVRGKEIEDLLMQNKLSLSAKLENFLLNDIKSPLEIINNYAELLIQKNLTEEVDEVIRMLQKQANSIEDITSSIISCSNKCSKTKLNKIHFNELVYDLLELLSEYCEMREVKLFKKLGDGAVVKVDRAKIYTAVYQVIKNACDASIKGGVIYLSTELKDNWIKLNIRDEGTGIAEDIQDKIFEPCFSEENKTGEGLGLLLAKNIMDAHEGNISFESSKKGTTFIIGLPVVNNSMME